MKKRYAIITDIHGNIEGLNAILNDIRSKNIDDIFCLGDIIHFGPNSKECIDLIMELNIKTVLGNHELYLLKGIDNAKNTSDEVKEYYESVKSTLSNKEIDYLKNLPLYYEINIGYDNIISDKKIILCHYLIKNEYDSQPFEESNLKEDINLWIKYNDPNKVYVIGHLHDSFDVNEVDGISGDLIEEIDEIPNIYVVDSAGCSRSEFVSYLILEIDKSISYEPVKVKFDRYTFINKLKNMDFPGKKDILEYFYGEDI